MQYCFLVCLLVGWLVGYIELILRHFRALLVVDTRSVQTTRLLWANFWSITWRAWVRVSRRPPILRVATLVLVFRFSKYVVFCLGVLLTHR